MSNEEFENLISDVIAKEWNMFHNVNGENRAYCQEDPVTFDGMRRAQFEAWSPETVQSYLADVEQAESEGRNIAREKYIHMMESTDPQDYWFLKEELPPISEEQMRLTNEIWEHMLKQTEEMNEKYPAVAQTGRPLRAEDEAYGNTSIETYQKGELLTYSEETLRLLLEHIMELEQQGINMAFLIREQTMINLGYESIDDAESLLGKPQS